MEHIYWIYTVWKRNGRQAYIVPVVATSEEHAANIAYKAMFRNEKLVRIERRL